MRKIITTTMLTLDGVMQAPGGSKEDTAEGFNYGGWATSWGEEEDYITKKIQAGHFDLLLGRLTYDIFAQYWPYHKDEAHWGAPFDRARKFVVSHKPVQLPWENSELITGDVVNELKKLKETDGPDLLVWGSSYLVQTLLKYNLIERMHLLIFPLTIGTGKKLFAEGTQPEHLKLVEAKITTTGVIFATYEPLGPLETKSV